MKKYSDYLNKFFPGVKVQKISVNAGFSCPNRDGTIGTGGCAYCRNDSFSPEYCISSKPIKNQIEDGKKFFSRKYPEMKYLAYFQSYTNTHGKDTETLAKLYGEALECENIVGLVIGTRPDTLPESVINLLGNINSHIPVFLEIGAESACDETLRLINRGHSWQDVADAVKRSSDRGLHCGLHLIAGLPGEGKDTIMATIESACSLPIDTLKLHQLQILKDTPLHKKWINNEIDIKPFSLEEYLSLCMEICKYVPESIIIERFLSQSPPDLVVAPKWGIKNYQFQNLLDKLLR